MFIRYSWSPSSLYEQCCEFPEHRAESVSTPVTSRWPSSILVISY
jgi:hypothetical protein